MKKAIQKIDLSDLAIFVGVIVILFTTLSGLITF